MEVTCPQCHSRFNLPDGVAKPGARLRCSVCKEVFRLPAPEPPDDYDDALSAVASGPAPKAKGGGKLRKLLLVVLCLLVLGGMGGGGWWAYKHFFSTREAPPLTEAELAKKVELLTMRNVRQYFVNNEQVGKIFVVEGKVVNEFPEPRELIQVEATLFRADNYPLVSKKQLGGTLLSLFQLEVLGENELESFMNNKIEILTNNTNIPKGGEVPFMVLFYNPPPDVAEFAVKIVDVKEVPDAVREAQGKK